MVVKSPHPGRDFPYPTARPHRLEAKDIALSRRKPGFESRWGHFHDLLRKTPLPLISHLHRSGPGLSWLAARLLGSVAGGSFQTAIVVPFVLLSCRLLLYFLALFACPLALLACLLVHAVGPFKGVRLGLIHTPTLCSGDFFAHLAHLLQDRFPRDRTQQLGRARFGSHLVERRRSGYRAGGCSPCLPTCASVTVRNSPFRLFGTDGYRPFRSMCRGAHFWPYRPEMTLSM